MKTARAWTRRVVGAAVMMACLPALSLADPVDRARAAAQALADATDAMQQAARGDDRVSALTQTIRAYEAGLEALRSELRTAALREATLQHSFDARSTELSQLLAVLVSIGRTQSGVQQLLHPAGPLGTARAAMLLGEVTPALGAEAARLAADLREAKALRAISEAGAALLLDGLAAAQTARAELGRAMSDRTDLPRRFTDDPAIMAALAEATDTLDAFARGLAGRSASEPAPPLRDFTLARGSLPLPVRGTLLRRAGEADAAGITRPGIVLATAPGALVTAPWSATVRYAGPLRGYTNVIILEPAEGHLLVLGGLEIVYVASGEVLAEGAALGLMPNPPDAGNAVVAGERTETLYLELRFRGDPVDPAPWFALTATGD